MWWVYHVSSLMKRGESFNLSDLSTNLYRNEHEAQDGEITPPPGHLWFKNGASPAGSCFHFHPYFKKKRKKRT